MSSWAALVPLAGGIIGGAAASRAKDEMAAEFRRELKRQGLYQKEATEALYPSIDKHGAEGMAERRAASTQDRLGEYESIYKVPLSRSSPRTSRDADYLRSGGERRATLASYGDAMSQQDYDTNRVMQQIAKILNFAQGTASVFPYKMYNAQHSQDELAAWGSLISSMGGAASAYESSSRGAPSIQATGASNNYSTAPVRPEVQEEWNRQIQAKIMEYTYGGGLGSGQYIGGFQ